MLSEAIRRRLEALNRAPIAGADSVSGAHPVAAPASAAHADDCARPLLTGQNPDGERAGALHRVRSGGPRLAWECENEHGKHLRLRRELAGLASPARARPAAELRRPRVLSPAAAAELAALAAGFPNGTLFLDLETCGFAGSMIFLVGLVWQTGGQLWLDQLLARNYAEEPAMLATLWQITATQDVLVTFNGKSFDWPMICDRTTRHRLPHLAQAGRRSHARIARASAQTALAIRQLVHCDLLHHARRTWRGRLPDCRLQTLERLVCGRQRRGDVPGSLVPAVYHEFVRSGELDTLEPVLHHNALDLVTLVEIGRALLSQSLAIGASSQSA